MGQRVIQQLIEALFSMRVGNSYMVSPVKPMAQSLLQCEDHRMSIYAHRMENHQQQQVRQAFIIIGKQAGRNQTGIQMVAPTFTQVAQNIRRKRLKLYQVPTVKV